jgi:flavin-dependent dehydrogenase
MDEKFDIVIIGGGPAGTSSAIALARAGRSVAVLERSGYEQARIGETLPPEARVPLVQIGVWDRFLEQCHAPSPGTASAWGQEELEENDFIFNPFGNGWHLDRRRFDAMLASAATEGGATFHRNARMTACEQGVSGEWRVEYISDERPWQLQARFLVDATGRACIPSRRQGATRTRIDRLTGVIGMFAAFQQEQDYQTLVEAAADGWWYSAWLPDARVVVAFMTDADLLPRGQSQLHAHWQRRLGETLHTRSRTGALPLERPLRLLAAGSEILECTAGKNWLATGDAAFTFDPLSSQGIYKALQSGLLAAEAIDNALCGYSSAARELSLRNHKTFERYLDTRRDYYSREQRWPASVFWQRRHSGELAILRREYGYPME